MLPLGCRPQWGPWPPLAPPGVPAGPAPPQPPCPSHHPCHAPSGQGPRRDPRGHSTVEGCAGLVRRPAWQHWAAHGAGEVARPTLGLTASGLPRSKVAGRVRGRVCCVPARVCAREAAAVCAVCPHVCVCERQRPCVLCAHVCVRGRQQPCAARALTSSWARWKKSTMSCGRSHWM